MMGSTPQDSWVLNSRELEAYNERFQCVEHISKSGTQPDQANKSISLLCDGIENDSCVFMSLRLKTCSEIHEEPVSKLINNIETSSRHPALASNSIRLLNHMITIRPYITQQIKPVHVRHLITHIEAHEIHSALTRNSIRLLNHLIVQRPDITKRSMLVSVQHIINCIESNTIP